MGNLMHQGTWAAGLFGAALWAIFMVGAFGGFSTGPKYEAWVVTSSDKIASHPTLTRIALPLKVAAAD